MIEYTNKIRESAKRLLEEGKVDCFIGYTKGSRPMASVPTVITQADQADSLIWDSNCAMNLVTYLRGRKGKIGIVATGCSSRNIVMHIHENQVKREDLVILGAPCTGMVDPKKVQEKAAGREVLEVTEEGDNLTVQLNGETLTLAKADVLQNNCATCAHRNPVIHDEMLGDAVEETGAETLYADVEEVENLPEDQRWASFEDAFSACIRCYACRDACPECYCPTCFVDESKPQWIGKSIDPTDTMTFHFLRAFHMAGRCTDCGSCERACPMDIPVRYLTKKLNKDAKQLYDHEAGLSVENDALLDAYRVQDLNDFIR